MHIYICNIITQHSDDCWWRLEYTECILCERVRTLSLFDNKLHLMAKLQFFFPCRKNFTIGWPRGSKIHPVHPCIGVRPSPTCYPGYNTKPSDGNASVLEL